MSFAARRNDGVEARAIRSCNIQEPLRIFTRRGKMSMVPFCHSEYIPLTARQRPVTGLVSHSENKTVTLCHF